MCALYRGEIQRTREGTALENLLDERVTRAIACKNDNEQFRGRREG